MNRIAQLLPIAIRSGCAVGAWAANVVGSISRPVSVGVLLRIGLLAALLLGQQGLILHELDHIGQLSERHVQPSDTGGSPDKCEQCLAHAGLATAATAQTSPSIPELPNGSGPAKRVRYRFLPPHQVYFHPQGPPSLQL